MTHQTKGSDQRTLVAIVLFVIGLLAGRLFLNGCGRREPTADPHDAYMEQMSRQNREYQRQLENVNRANRGLPPLPRTDD